MDTIRLGDQLRAANHVVPPKRSPDDVVSGASLVGLWLLIPFALGGIAYVLLGIVGLLRLPSDEVAQTDGPATLVATGWWLVLTLLLQGAYWVVVARGAGLQPLRGLWGLVPVVALVPTFAIARAALTAGRGSVEVPGPAESLHPPSSGFPA